MTLIFQLVFETTLLNHYVVSETTIQNYFRQWRHPRGDYGALAPPIFEISISKTTKLAPNIWQKVCLAPPKYI